MPKQPSNRRETPRALISIAVRKRAGNQIHICQANNISADGIFLAHVKDGLPPTPPGNKCWVEFSLPNRPDVLIAARGVVVRQKAFARFILSAVRFACIAPSHRRLIQTYIQGPHLSSPLPSFLPLPAHG